jgi:hypothetical protein
VSGKAKKWTAAMVRQNCKKVGDCLIWTGRVDARYGHPIASVNGRHTCMRPYYFTKLLGRVVPAGHKVGPSCGNKLCMSCLITRTPRDALLAAYSMGDRECGPATRMRITMGRSRTKLSPKKADEIRASDEPVKVLAERYGVCKETIRAVRRGDRWNARPEARASIFDWAQTFKEAA